MARSGKWEAVSRAVEENPEFFEKALSGATGLDAEVVRMIARVSERSYEVGWRMCESVADDHPEETALDSLIRINYEKWVESLPDNWAELKEDIDRKE
jgi:hypothetical protein